MQYGRTIINLSYIKDNNFVSNLHNQHKSSINPKVPNKENKNENENEEKLLG